MKLLACIPLSVALFALGCTRFEAKSDEIAWEHPLAKGLVFLSVAPAQGAPRDLVSKAPGALLDAAALGRPAGGPAAVDVSTGPDSRLRFAEQRGFAELGDFTIVTRFYPTALNVWQPLMVKEESRTAIRYGLWIRPSNTLYFEIAGASLEGSKVIPANQWSTIVAARAGNTVHFYVNGELGAAGSVPGRIKAGGDLWIGDVSNGRDDAQGFWQYGAIYDRALTDEEIRQWHASGDQVLASLAGQ